MKKTPMHPVRSRRIGQFQASRSCVRICRRTLGLSATRPWMARALPHSWPLPIAAGAEKCAILDRVEGRHGQMGRWSQSASSMRTLPSLGGHRVQNLSFAPGDIGAMACPFRHGVISTVMVITPLGNGRVMGHVCVHVPPAPAVSVSYVLLGTCGQVFPVVHLASGRPEITIMAVDFSSAGHDPTYSHFPRHHRGPSSQFGCRMINSVDDAWLFGRYRFFPARVADAPLPRRSRKMVRVTGSW